MKITETDVDYVAKLANLEVAADEKKELADQLNRIVEYMDQLNRLNTEDVEPTAQVIAPSRRSMRDDLVTSRTGSSEAGRSVKLFKVPRVIPER